MTRNYEAELKSKLAIREAEAKRDLAKASAQMRELLSPLVVGGRLAEMAEQQAPEPKRQVLGCEGRRKLEDETGEIAMSFQDRVAVNKAIRSGQVTTVQEALALIGRG